MYKTRNVRPSVGYVMFDESALDAHDIVLDRDQMTDISDGTNASQSQPMSQAHVDKVVCDKFLIYGHCSDLDICPYEHDDHEKLYARAIRLRSLLDEECAKV